MSIVIERYRASDQLEWEQFVRKSEIDTILFRRSFMDYHKDRFEDYSAICRDAQSSRVIGLFPANLANENEIISHQGLTFGGVICHDLKTEKFFAMISQIVQFYRENGLKSIKIKLPPSIVNPRYDGMVKYALHHHQFQLLSRDLSSAIDLSCPVKLNSGKKGNIKKAQSQHISIDENVPVSEAYDLICASLRERYDTVPTHSFDELSALLRDNDRSIYLIGARNTAHSLCAVSVVFVSEKTVHTQYLAASAEGRSSGALDFLIFKLATELYSQFSYVSLGTSSEAGGINAGLMLSKEGLGATCYEMDTYLLQLR